MNWIGIAMLEALAIVLISLMVRHFQRCFDRAIFVASRGYRPVRDRGYELGPYWTWHVPQSEKRRLENIGERPKTLTLEEAFRRAKLEEERELLQLPAQKVVEMVPRQSDWR